MKRSDVDLIIDIVNSIIERQEMIRGQLTNRALVNEATKILDMNIERILEQCEN